jgi:NitT/TauT family transport system substrate-binding protein
MRGLAAAAGAAAFGLLAVGGSLGQEMPTLKFALAVADANFNPTTASAFRLADELGIYEKHGVKVEFVTLDGTPQAVAALYAGDVDIADVTVDAALRLRADNDVPVRGVIAIGQGASFLVAGKNDIETVEELAGRTFAIADTGSLDHNLTVALLRARNVADPSFVAVGAPDVRVQALVNGRVDATTVSFGTYLSIADTPGIHVIVDTEELSKYLPSPTKLIFALESTLESKRDAIERFTAALIETSRLMKDHPDQWVAAVAAARDDLPLERIEAISQFIDTQWCVDGCMDAKNLASVVDYLYANPDFKNVKRIPAEDIVDLSFTQKANESLGAYTAAAQ